jgi:hypothetical protein
VIEPDAAPVDLGGVAPAERGIDLDPHHDRAVVLEHAVAAEPHAVGEPGERQAAARLQEEPEADARQREEQHRGAEEHDQR